MDQQPTGPHAVSDAGLFIPFGELNALPSSEFVTLAHPEFPRHSVRIKQSQFCDESTRSYTGYADIEARHLFFYFFESRHDPDTDDVILWINGGPGSSSALGLFMELGPCRTSGPNVTAPFEYAWNERANVFFIDQPVGVGFSYAEYGEHVDNTIEASKDMAAFMAIFFEHFTKLRGRALHLAGESYAGRYLPVFASAIYDQNPRLVEHGLAPVNLSSLMIGNGGTQWLTTMLSWYDAQCADPTFPPIENISTCVEMKRYVSRCETRLRESCIDRFDKIGCRAATDFCWQALGSNYISDPPAKNSYDRARPCLGLKDRECYPAIQDIEAYLSLPGVQAALGVDPARRGNFTLTSTGVNLAFDAALDLFLFPAEHYIAALLERRVRVLLYVGANDWVSNWIGVERMSLGLEWTRSEAYKTEPLRDWYAGGDVAGLTRSGGGLTYATVANAGHLVPFDQPMRALELVNRWLAREDL
ncbi:serine carboxypeptidase [Trametes elegans]|nr:serine carboxypeptidase [Trametes elegans]